MNQQTWGSNTVHPPKTEECVYCLRYGRKQLGGEDCHYPIEKNNAITPHKQYICNIVSTYPFRTVSVHYFQFLHHNSTRGTYGVSV